MMANSLEGGTVVAEDEDVEKALDQNELDEEPEELKEFEMLRL